MIAVCELFGSVSTGGSVNLSTALGTPSVSVLVVVRLMLVTYLYQCLEIFLIQQLVQILPSHGHSGGVRNSNNLLQVKFKL